MVLDERLSLADRPRVLVVEGDDETRSTLVAALSGANYVVRAVAEGADIALEARTILPDIVLLETRMQPVPVRRSSAIWIVARIQKSRRS